MAGSIVACAVTLTPFGSHASEGTTLRLGAPIERTFQDRASHRFNVRLESGDYARVLIEEKGGDLWVVVTSPAGDSVFEADSPVDRSSREVVSLLAEPAGPYTLEVKPRTAAEAEVGGYRIWLETLRPATPEDRLRLEAERTNASAYCRWLERRPEEVAKVLADYRRALEIWDRLGDSAEQASSYYRIGLVYFLGNQPAEASPAFQRALEIWRSLEDTRQTAKVLNQVGRTRQVLGDTPGALLAFQESIALAQEAGATDIQAVTLNNLAKLHITLGDLPSAIESYQKSLKLNESRGDDSGVALILHGLGNVYDLQGKPSEAVDSFERSLVLAARLKLGNLQGNALNSLGNLYLRLGQPYKALQYLLPALDRYGDDHNAPSQGLVLVNLGSLLVELGEPAEGQEMLLKALPLLRDPRDQARAKLVLSQVSRDRGDVEGALHLAEEALATQRQMEHPAGEAAALSAIGLLHLGRGDPKKAVEAMTQALKLFKAAHSLPGQAQILRGLGSASTDLGDFLGADRSFEQALSLSQELGDTSEESRILEESARRQQIQGKLDAARTNLEQAIQRLESLRSEIAGDQFRASSFSAQRKTYETYVDVLEQLQPASAPPGLDARSFEAAEKARARGILDFLGQARVDIREGDPDLLKEEQRLRLEMNAKAARRTEILRKPEGAAELAALDEELTALSTQYQIIEARLEASSPRYARLKQPEVRLADVQKALDGDTILLEYFLAEPRSYLWLVTPDSLASFELPGRARIEELARRVHEQLGNLNAQSGTAERKDLEELSRLLLGPVADRLKGKRLAVVPDGALLYVPFGALPVTASDRPGSVPLIVEHEVVHLPSAAVVREIRRSREGRPLPPAALALVADPVFEKDDPRLQTVLASVLPKAGATRGTGAGPSPPLTTADLQSDFLGLPRQGGGAAGFARLTWTRREAEAIASEVQGRDVLLALDFKASRNLATAEDLGRYRILHFATHGVLDTQHPALSGLVFSQVDEQGKFQDGFLRLHDIYHLRLHADLVVLSGCETALGKSLRGEGIVGLTRGFFHAGASQVVSSLWPVRDRATAELMQRFYRAMFRDGLRPSAALRRAQIEMWSQRQWRDPYYWAAFIAQGDWQVEVR